MSGYSEHAAAIERERMIKRYGPDKIPSLSEENLIYNIARANKAEHELLEIKKTLRALGELLGVGR